MVGACCSSVLLKLTKEVDLLGLRLALSIVLVALCSTRISSSMSGADDAVGGGGSGGGGGGGTAGILGAPPPII